MPDFTFTSAVSVRDPHNYKFLRYLETSRAYNLHDSCEIFRLYRRFHGNLSFLPHDTTLAQYILWACACLSVYQSQDGVVYQNGWAYHHTEELYEYSDTVSTDYR